MYKRQISPEEFAEAGFHNVEPIPEEYAGLAKGLSACDLSKHSNVPGEGFGNNNANRAHIESQVAILNEYSSEIVPQIFVYGPASGIGTHCYAQLDTLRGGLLSEAAGLAGSTTLEHTCTVAVENLEALYLANSNQ